MKKLLMLALAALAFTSCAGPVADMETQTAQKADTLWKYDYEQTAPDSAEFNYLFTVAEQREIARRELAARLVWDSMEAAQ